MDVFHWDQNLETGLSEVDSQHQHLVRVTNQYGTLLSQNDLNTIDIEQVFSELVSYTQYHFDEEEKLMVSTGVDTRHQYQHEQEHQSFLQEVGVLHDEISSGKTEADKRLFEFLMNWLVYHILGSDQTMARQIKAVSSGVSPDEAYDNETKEIIDKANALLLKSLNNLFHQVADRNKELLALNQSLESKVEERTRELKELAITDVLTGLPNRRYAMQQLERLWEESTEKGNPLACMMIDADGFKAINDTYGHDAGDIVLHELAKNLRFAVRTDDLVCRLGGDEFFIICPKTNKEGAMHIAKQTHGKIADLKVEVNGGTWYGSISVGVSARTERMSGFNDLIKAADLGVYAAKSAGKNCVKLENFPSP